MSANASSNNNRPTEPTSKPMMEDGKRYVVVTTTYPTNYGANRGMNWSKADLLSRTDRQATSYSFGTRDEAIGEARALRNRNNYFTDECEPNPDDYSDEEEDMPSYQEGDYRFTNTDEPPYDSADLQNWDNDDEVCIDVMTREEFDALEAAEAAYLKREHMRRLYEAKVRGAVTKLQIQDSGRVHYSTPPLPYDVKAELEVVEEDARDDPGAKYVDVEAKARGTAIPANASTIKSLMYRGGKNDLAKFCGECRGVSTDDGVIATEQDLANVALLRILRACTSLEELHLKASGWATISPAFIGKILSAAPHLRKTLKVLSFSLIETEPGALPIIGEFKAIERLDLFMCLSGEYYSPPSTYDENYEVEVFTGLPYDEPLMELVDSLPNIKRLDIGNGGSESQQYLFEYLLSPHTVSAIKDAMADQNGGRLTMDDKNMPEPWSSKEREKAARYHALVSIMEDDTENPDIRAMAEEEAKTCPTCVKPAKRRCTGCKRQYYCSVECQKKDYKKNHKKICREAF